MKNYRYFRLFIMIFQTYHGDEIAFDDNNNNKEYVEEDDLISKTNYPH